MSRTQEADFLFAERQQGGGGHKMWNTPCQSHQLLIDVSVKPVELINAWGSTRGKHGQPVRG